MPVQGSSAISKLPPYLTAQMVRFFYKVDTQQKAKILRKASPDFKAPWSALPIQLVCKIAYIDVHMPCLQCGGNQC